jgi:hypothetical protein
MTVRAEHVTHESAATDAVLAQLTYAVVHDVEVALEPVAKVERLVLPHLPQRYAFDSLKQSVVNRPRGL